MYLVKSNISSPIPASNIEEAKIIKGREYNLYLADMLIKDSSANPKRANENYSAYIQDGQKRVEWQIVAA